MRSCLQKVGFVCKPVVGTNTCIKGVSMVCPLLVGCVVLRGWLLPRWYPGGGLGVTMVCCLWPCGHSELNEMADIHDRDDTP
jgi:hypothetical protein